MRQSGLLLDDNRDVNEVCVTRPLVTDCVFVSTEYHVLDWNVKLFNRIFFWSIELCFYIELVEIKSVNFS